MPFFSTVASESCIIMIIIITDRWGNLKSSFCRANAKIHDKRSAPPQLALCISSFFPSAGSSLLIFFFLPDRLNRVHHPVRESVNPTRDVPHNLFKFFSPANSFLLRGFHVFETIKRSQHQDLYKSFNSSSSVCFFASRPSVIQGWEAFSALIIASQSKKRRKLYLTNNPQSSGLVYFITWERLNETSARWA